MLSRGSGFDIVGSAGNGRAAIEAIASAVADIHVVLVDCELPDITGIDLVRTLLPLHPPLRFALLDAHGASAPPQDAMTLVMALAPRVCQVSWHAAAADLRLTLRNLQGEGLAGGGQAAKDAVTPAQNKTPGANLTQRERELLTLMGLGLSNQQISVRLRIAMPTVKFHVTHILSKMGADNRTGAVLLGLRHGLVQLQ